MRNPVFANCRERIFSSNHLPSAASRPFTILWRQTSKASAKIEYVYLIFPFSVVVIYLFSFSPVLRTYTRTFLHTLNNTRDTRSRHFAYSHSPSVPRYWRHVPRARVNALPAHGPKDKSMQMTYDISPSPPFHPPPARGNLFAPAASSDGNTAERPRTNPRHRRRVPRNRNKKNTRIFRIKIY